MCVGAAAQVVQGMHHSFRGNYAASLRYIRALLRDVAQPPTCHHHRARHSHSSTSTYTTPTTTSRQSRPVANTTTMNALAAGPAARPRPKVKYPDAYPHWHYPADFVLKPSPFDSGVESAHVVRRHHHSFSLSLHSHSLSNSTTAPTSAASTSSPSSSSCHSRSASTSTTPARASGSRADPVSGVTDPAAAPSTSAARTASDPDAVAYYLSAPSSSSQGAARRLLDAFRPRAPVYLTSFVYEDAGYIESPAAPSTSTPAPSPSASTPVAAPPPALRTPDASVLAPVASATSTPTTTSPRASPMRAIRQQRCTRSELTAAFGRLVQDWHRFWAFGMDVLYHVPTSPPAGREAEFEERFGDSISRLRAVWQSTQYRLFWGTYLFGDYLEALSEMEDAGRLPSRWPRTGLDTSSRGVRFPGCSLTHRAPGGKIDDYAFRAAKVINAKQGERIPEVEDAYTDIESLMWDMLEFKGLDPELSLEALPKMRGAAYSTPGRFEPPPPPYAPPSYEDACASCSGCSSAESSSRASSRASSGWGSPRSSYDSASSE